MQLINFRLLSHPVNYLTVFLMLVIAGVGGHLLLSLFGTEPATGDQPKSAYQPQ